MKKRLLFINNMAAPYQVKFCYALQEFYDAQMWFYTHLEKNRPKWWAMPLGDKCKILEGSRFFPILNYSNRNLLKEVTLFKPDIIIAGGFFFPSQYRVKNWAKKTGVKYIGVGERVSYAGYGKAAQLLKKQIKRLTTFLYRDIDLYIAMGEKPMEQMINEFGFPPKKVVLGRYPQDIDVNLKHPLRKTKDNPVIIFPNRLDAYYNPLFALEVFKKLSEKFPEVSMKMNELGDLKRQCNEYIRENNLSGKVGFLQGIKAWDELPEIYKKADVALFTATDSNGPNALIECMASGTGVILSKYIYNTGAYAKNEENCFICDLNIQEYVDAISQYIEKEGLLEKHGGLSKKLVENRSIKATARFYHEIIKNIFLYENCACYRC